MVDQSLVVRGIVINPEHFGGYFPFLKLDVRVLGLLLQHLLDVVTSPLIFLRELLSPVLKSGIDVGPQKLGDRAVKRAGNSRCDLQNPSISPQNPMPR